MQQGTNDDGDAWFVLEPYQQVHIWNDYYQLGQQTFLVEGFNKCIEQATYLVVNPCFSVVKCTDVVLGEQIRFLKCVFLCSFVTAVKQ